MTQVNSRAVYDVMVEVLNRILKADPDALNNLFEGNVKIKNVEELNKFVVLRGWSDGDTTLSMLGILNSVLLSEEYRIAAHYEDSDPFERITKFSVLELKKGLNY